jgi:hypothetical protein
MSRNKNRIPNKRVSSRTMRPTMVAPRRGWIPMLPVLPVSRRMGGACPYMMPSEEEPEMESSYFGGAEMDMMPARLPARLPPQTPYYALAPPQGGCGPACGTAYPPPPYMYGMHPVGGLSLSDITSKVCVRARCRYAKDAIIKVRKLMAEIRSTREKNPNDTKDIGDAWDKLVADLQVVANTFEASAKSVL